MEKIIFYFFIFIIYSVVGWFVETIYVAILNKRFLNRGFLIGPYLPIYGSSAVAMILLLEPFKKNIILLFITSAIIASIMEYITSYFMEKLFKARWWDYTHEKFNLNGRVCLRGAALFGLLGIIMMYFINPYLINIVNNLSQNLIIILSLISFIIITIDLIISFKVITKIQKTADVVRKDYTEEITEKVRLILRSKSLLTKRLINSFPNLKIVNIIKKDKN